MPNKSLTKAFLLLGISLIALFAPSCSMDLEPSWKKGTTLSIELGAATAEQSRALLTQSGFLYICPDSKVLGPYEISAGTRFSTTEVEPGTYKRFILVYSPYKLPAEDINSALNGSAPFAEAIAANVSGRASWGAASGVIIKPSTDNLIAMTLVPAVASNLVIDPSADSYEVPVAPDEGETVVSRFIRVDNPLSSESTVLGLEISLDASTASAALPQANIPTVIPVYTREGKASSIFSLKSYADGTAIYTGAPPSVNETLYISVSFTPDAERSAIHVKLVQKLDKPVEPEYTTYMKISGTGTYLNKRFFAYVHEKTEIMQPDQAPAAYGLAIATGTSVDIGLLDISGEPWTPDPAKTYMAGFFIDVENFWPDLTDPDIMTYVNSGQFFYGGMLHAMNDADISGSGAVAALAAFDCSNLVAVKTAALHVNDGTGNIAYQMLNMWGDGTLRIPMPIALTSVKGRFVEWNTKADGTGTAYKAQGVYTEAADELVLYAKWIAESSLPKGNFTVSLSGQSAYDGKQVVGVLSEASTENHEPAGFFFGKIATDGTFSGAFTDWVGIPLTVLPTLKYNVSLAIDKDGALPELDYLHFNFDFSKLSLIANKQVDYTGSGSFSQSFTATDFMTLRTITAYPNYPGSTEEPVVIHFQEGMEFTLAPEMTTFAQSGYTLAGWAKTANATTPDFALGSSVTVTQDLILYAVWKEDIVVPAGLFSLQVTNAQAVAGKQLVAIIASEAETVANPDIDYVGTLIGRISTEGAFSGTFLRIDGTELKAFQPGPYTIMVIVDAGGKWPTIASLDDLNSMEPDDSFRFFEITGDYSGTEGISRLVDYASFTAPPIVTLDPNFTGGPAPVIVTALGSIEPSVDTFVWSGHALVGWSTVPGATTAEFPVGDLIPVDGDMTLYAVWIEGSAVSFIVSFPSVGDPEVSPATQNVAAGTQITLSADPGFDRCEWFLTIGYGATEFIGGSSTCVYNTESLAPGVWEIVLHAWDSNNFERTASCWLTIE